MIASITLLRYPARLEKKKEREEILLVRWLLLFSGGQDLETCELLSRDETKSFLYIQRWVHEREERQTGQGKDRTRFHVAASQSNPSPRANPNQRFASSFSFPRCDASLSLGSSKFHNPNLYFLNSFSS